MDLSFKTETTILPSKDLLRILEKFGGCPSPDPVQDTDKHEPVKAKPKAKRKTKAKPKVEPEVDAAELRKQIRIRGNQIIEKSEDGKEVLKSIIRDIGEASQMTYVDDSKLQDVLEAVEAELL